MIINTLLQLFLLWAGGDYRMAIVTVYVTLIIAGRRTFPQIPAKLQPAVESELTELGLDTDRKPV